MSPEEFSDFYAASFRRLVGHLYAMTGDRAEAQDVVQEAFVRAWSHRGRLDRDGAPEAWVRATAWRIAVSRWHRARRGRLLLRSHPVPQVAPGPTPDRVAFIDALRRVPGEQRRALVLYYVCDLSVAQIAAETGVPNGTVKARLARGRTALAPYLRESVGLGRGGGAARGGQGDSDVELGDELHRLAEEGAEQARPLPPSEVIRRGARRRHRRILSGAVATVAVAGVITAGVVVGVAGRRPGSGAARHPARPRDRAGHPAGQPGDEHARPVPTATSPSAVGTTTPSGSPSVPVPSGTR